MGNLSIRINKAEYQDTEHTHNQYNSRASSKQVSKISD